MIYPASPENIAKAAAIIRQGGIVAFPTETVYGLGANAGDESAVRKIFSLKRRPAYNPLIVHLASLKELSTVADISQHPKAAERVEKLKVFWPGPLSLILPKQPAVAPSVTAGLNSVAIRIPNHTTALQLITAASVPIAAPSANLSSFLSPTTAQHVADEFPGLIEMILDGGPCQIGIESTVLSLLGDEVEILRPGGVAQEQIASALGENVIWGGTKKTPGQNSASQPLSPGQSARHYAPRTKVQLLKDTLPSPLPPRVGLISFSTRLPAQLPIDFTMVSVLSKDGDLDEVAAGLFAALRQLDKASLDLILVDSCPAEGLGQAIMDRLLRACQKEELST